MSRNAKLALFWTPRILCIVFALFLSLFSLDVFGEGYGFWETLLALLIHLVPGLAAPAPALVLLSVATVLASVGGDLFISIHKRTVGLKDTGQLFPGYGGVLDRYDSLLSGAPLFALASAIVTNVGGPLSHGSIVAREYGIPAVMGTGVATKRTVHPWRKLVPVRVMLFTW